MLIFLKVPQQFVENRITDVYFGAKEIYEKFLHNINFPRNILKVPHIGIHSLCT